MTHSQHHQHAPLPPWRRTVPDAVEELVRDAKPGPVRWKVVIAAESPWAGVVYETRAGQRRESFEGPEEFVRAIMRLTGWHPPDLSP